MNRKELSQNHWKYYLIYSEKLDIKGRPFEQGFCGIGRNV